MLPAVCPVSTYGLEQRVTFEILVVDNASEDGSHAMLAQDFPQVRVIESKRIF